MNSLHAQRAIITLGDIELEVFMLQDGTYRLSEEGTAKAAGKPESNARQFWKSKAPEALPFKNFKAEKFSIDGEKTRINGIPVELAMSFWTTQAKKGNLKAQILLKTIGENPIPPFEKYAGTYVIFSKPKGKGLNEYLEASYVKRLQNELGGEREVPTKAGYIDLLTSSELIEVKKLKRWKEAVGQVEIYGDYFPSHQKRIHLFGACHESYLEVIKEHCDKRQIILTWES